MELCFGAVLDISFNQAAIVAERDFFLERVLELLLRTVAFVLNGVEVLAPGTGSVHSLLCDYSIVFLHIYVEKDSEICYDSFGPST